MSAAENAAQVAIPGVASYRKRPVVIEAVQLTPDADLVEIARWCGGIARDALPRAAGLSWLILPTREGDMHAEEGDWIIRGVRGEFYPCGADIFAATYDPAPAGGDFGRLEDEEAERAALVRAVEAALGYQEGADTELGWSKVLTEFREALEPFTRAERPLLGAHPGEVV